MIMKKLTFLLFGLTMLFSLSGCGLMEDAFKAGIFFGILFIAIVGLIIWLLRFGIKQISKKYTWEVIK